MRGARPLAAAWPFGVAVAAFAVGLAVLSGCSRDTGRPSAAVPQPDTRGMEARVAQRVSEARAAVLAAPASADAWGRYGNVCHAHRLYVEAAACYRQACSLAPKEFRWAYFLARTRELESAPGSEVIDLYGRAVRLRPDYAPAHVRLGDALVRENRKEEAREAYERASALDPNLARAHRGLGQVLLLLGDAAGAVRALERAAQQTPEDGAVFAALAQAYARLDDRERSDAAARRSRELEQTHTLPDAVIQEVGGEGVSALLCAQRAADYMRRGEFRRAVAELEVVLEDDPDHAGAHHDIGVAHSRLGELAPGERHLRRALELQPESADARRELALLLVQVGRIDEAVEEYRELLRREPGDAPTRVLMATALAQGGRLAEALVEFENAAETRPLGAFGHLNWGNALRQAGEPQKAIEHYEAAILLNRTYPNAHYNLGTLLESLGRRAEAIAHYRQAVKLDPGNDAAARLHQLGASD
jgi:tetratricopeptide (TPR) repeat protein